MYRLVSRPTPKIAVVFAVDFDRTQVWPSCKVRKRWKCAECGLWIEVGQEAFRPMTNLRNRMHRIHPLCMGAMKKFT